MQKCLKFLYNPSLSCIFVNITSFLKIVLDKCDDGLLCFEHTPQLALEVTAPSADQVRVGLLERIPANVKIFRS
jgi:hypothetical protein